MSQIDHSVSTWQQPCPGPASPERAALVGEIARRVLALGDGRLLVGIDGLTASGKTSFGHELAASVAAAGRPALRATLDDFKQPWKDRHLYDRESGEGYYRNAYDYESARRLLLDPCRSPRAGACALCSIDPHPGGPLGGRHAALPGQRAHRGRRVRLPPGDRRVLGLPRLDAHR
ncbi:hypothetical protein ACFQE7_04910 [Nonomuraea ferruginea]|uniref:hypothetical protein n=1 Tax=Nonomuraea ferruginea TaxID=46174 RepID=UPI00360EA866